MVTIILVVFFFKCLLLLNFFIKVFRTRMVFGQRYAVSFHSANNSHTFGSQVKLGKFH